MRLQLSTLRFGASGCIGVCSVKSADEQHPNKMPFKGVLLILDEPSDKPPHGAEGHRIFVPKAVAQRRLSTLISMGMNYSHELASHAPQHKVGVITGAQIVGNKVVVNGFLWQRDFPSMKRDLKSGRLGMSMELQDVSVRNKNAPVWYLEDFHFSGATILFKSAAAYTSTSLAAAGVVKRLSGEWGKLVRAEVKKQLRLAAAAEPVRKSEGGSMAKILKKEQGASSEQDKLIKAIAAGVGPAISHAISESLSPVVGMFKKQNASIARIAASVEESKALTLEAAKDEDEENEEEATIEASKEEDDMDAEKGKKKEDDDDDDDNDDDGNDDEDEELDAEMEKLEDDTSEEDEPGELNKDTENKGDKTTREGGVGKAKHMAVKASRDREPNIRASSIVRELYASHRALRKKYKTLKAKAEGRLESLQNKVDALEAQAESFAERTDRRSVSAELGNFLSKNNVDVRELRAEGRLLSVGEVDQIFANSPVELDPTTRMWFKNQLLQAQLMEQGEVHRNVQ